MPRTTATEVRKIIEVDVSVTDSDLEIFIFTSNELVNEICAPVVTYTEARLTLIETWLAAHFYAIREKQVTNESAGSVSAGYQSSLGLNLQVTHYGQQALLLDTAGGLAKLNVDSKEGTKSKVGFFFVGGTSRNYSNH